METYWAISKAIDTNNKMIRNHYLLIADGKSKAKHHKAIERLISANLRLDIERGKAL